MEIFDINLQQNILFSFEMPCYQLHNLLHSEEYRVRSFHRLQIEYIFFIIIDFITYKLRN